MNLLGNAVKFTFKGFIKLSVWKVNQNSIGFSVEDTGIGIKQVNMNNLFKAFGKLESKENLDINPTGVGLGLVISQ